MERVFETSLHYYVISLSTEYKVAIGYRVGEKVIWSRLCTSFDNLAEATAVYNWLQSRSGDTLAELYKELN